MISCEAECSFSALKRLKGSTRSRMLDSRLAALALMNVHYKTALKVDVNSIIKTFVQLHRENYFVILFFLIENSTYGGLRYRN